MRNTSHASRVSNTSSQLVSLVLWKSCQPPAFSFFGITWWAFKFVAWKHGFPPIATGSQSPQPETSDCHVKARHAAPDAGCPTRSAQTCCPLRRPGRKHVALTLHKPLLWWKKKSNNHTSDTLCHQLSRFSALGVHQISSLFAAFVPNKLPVHFGPRN